MEAAAALWSSVGICCGPVNSGFFSTHTAPDLVRFGFKSSVYAPWIKLHPSASQVRYVNQRVAYKSGRHYSTRASLQPSGSEGPPDPIAPLQFESPVGQFLSQVMITHPHLVPAAVDQQLKQLQTDTQKDEPSVCGADLVLYRRIAEVKAKERKKALEEILYALVVQKFMDADVPLIPALTFPLPWPEKEDQFALIHSPEAHGMIQNHLALILGNRMGDPTSETQISKFRVGQVYAASVMYGYFLKRVDQRFQLEKTMKMKTLPKGNLEVPEEKIRSFDDHGEFEESYPSSSSRGVKASKLRSYVMSLDGETLQRYATIRSKEAVRIIEKHTEALFGRPQGTVDSSEENVVRISFGGLKRLLLEAVAFGSFLWDVESYVDSMCHFVTF